MSSPYMSRIKVILKSGKDQSVRRLHPWVFSGAIKKIAGTPREGEIVEVSSNKDEFLALGHYQIGSIAIRIFSFQDIEPDYNFWKDRIGSAYKYRCELGITNHPEINAYRLINAEGDGMPGLIIDYYNGTAVLQMHSIGMHYLRDMIVDILKGLYSDRLKAVFDKSETTLPFKSGINATNEYLLGGKSGSEITEYGNRFIVNWEEGQKTGFFLDQRENRKLLQNYATDRQVLNMFCFTGGFSVYALKGKARMVHSVDSSASAIELTGKNIETNFGQTGTHNSYVADAFNYMKDINDRYDLIILDPPAFAKHHNVLHNALQGYKKLNAMAIENIKKGGIIFTFSCSQVVSKENFKKSVYVAAANTGRSVKILHQLTQPADHPVSIYHPEGEYLKGLVLYVE